MTAPAAGRLARAATLLAEGDWRGAHALVQDDPSETAAWLHGIAHALEGDLANARHWYRRAHRPFPGPDAVAHEIALARRSVDPAAPPVP